MPPPQLSALRINTDDGVPEMGGIIREANGKEKVSEEQQALKDRLRKNTRQEGEKKENDPRSVLLKKLGDFMIGSLWLNKHKLNLTQTFHLFLDSISGLIQIH